MKFTPWRFQNDGRIKYAEAYGDALDENEKKLEVKLNIKDYSEKHWSGYYDEGDN